MNGQDYTKLCEGFTPVAKKDTPPAWEIGYGFDSVNGAPVKPGDTMTQEQADAYFPTPYNLAQTQASSILGSAWIGLNPVRQAALIDMAYEMGGTRLSRFVHMLSAIRSGDWQTAHDECLNSDYGQEVENRANRTSYMLLNGTWPIGYGG
jgi:GH24 family phage-related lysozyme (muramidase)